MERFENIPILYCLTVVFFYGVFRLLQDLFLEDFQYMVPSLLAHMIASLSAFLILLVIYPLATKERSDKVMGVLAVFLSTILLGPMIDFLLIRALGWTNFKHTYIPPHESTRELVIRFFTFFGLGKDLYSGTLDVTLGPSVGLIISVLVMLILSFLYFHYKNESLIRSTLFTFVIYFVLFMGSSTLIMMVKPLELLGIDPVPTIELRLWYHLLWILILLVINFYLLRRDYFVGLLRRIRPFGLMHYLALFAFGMGIGHVTEPLSRDQGTFFTTIFALCSVMIAWIFVLFLDELVGVSGMRNKKGRKTLLFDCISLATARILTVIFFFLAIIYSYAGGSTVLFLVLLFMGGSFFYSAPPFKLKSVPVISKLPIAVNSLILVMLGRSITGDMFHIPRVVPIFFLTVFFLAAHFTDIKDYEVDLRNGVKTLPILLGLKRAKVLTGVFFAVAMFSGYFMMDAVIDIPSSLATIIMASLAGAGTLGYYLISKDDFSENPVYMVYLIMVFLLTYVLFVI